VALLLGFENFVYCASIPARFPPADRSKNLYRNYNKNRGLSQALVISVSAQQHGGIRTAPQDIGALIKS
jgi:hypothetical protein